MRIRRTLKRVFLLSTVVGAVLAWRERQFGKNNAR